MITLFKKLLWFRPKYSVLVDWQIRQLLVNNVVTREGANLNYLVNPASLDITLAGEFLVERRHEGGGPNPVLQTWRDSSSPMYKHVSKDYLELAPGESCLAVTRELFTMPNNLLGEYILKSRLARFGLDHKIAGYIDPGFRGKITLELINSNKHTTLVIAKGQRIGQIKFTSLPTPQKPYEGHYSLNGISPARRLRVDAEDPSIILQRL